MASTPIKWTLILALVFLTNAVAKAADISRGDLKSAVETSQSEKIQAEKLVRQLLKNYESPGPSKIALN